MGINDIVGDDMKYYTEVKSPRGRSIVITRSNTIRSKQDFEHDLDADISPSGENSVENEPQNNKNNYQHDDDNEHEDNF